MRKFNVGDLVVLKCDVRIPDFPELHEGMIGVVKQKMKDLRHAYYVTLAIPGHGTGTCALYAMEMSIVRTLLGER